MSPSASFDHMRSEFDQPLDEIEQARARLYRLLGVLLARPPDEALLAALCILNGDAELGEALRSIAVAARGLGVVEARREYDALFIGMTRGEVVPYASFYLTGFLYERPLARLRADMERLGVALAEGHSDPEDHIATLMQVMSGLIDGVEPSRPSLERQHEFFRRHLEPWADRFFIDLESAASARLYRAVAATGRLLMAIEFNAFQMEFA
jgi:TorA maturation chaperone TorD